MSDFERTCETILKAWTPAMAETRRKAEAVEPVRLASKCKPLKPCPHGKLCVSHCRICERATARERVRRHRARERARRVSEIKAAKRATGSAARG